MISLRAYSSGNHDSLILELSVWVKTFKAQAFAQPESSMARLNSGRWKNKNQTYIDFGIEQPVFFFDGTTQRFW